LCSVLKYDGAPLRPIEVVKQVLQYEGTVSAR